MADDVVIAGVGVHPFGRHSDRSLKDLARVAGLRALLDAGIGPQGVQMVYSANAMAGMLQGQEMVRGQTVLREIGIEGVPVVNVENACAGGSTAFAQAVMAIRSGAADVALAVGFEKMFVADRSRTLDALESAADLDVVSGLGIQFTAVYGLRLRPRLADGSITRQDLAEVAVKSHANGARNPYAQHQKPVTAEQVLESRMIADPLTLLMCSSICDGAAAVVLARDGALRQPGRPTVRVLASASTSGFTLDPDGGPSGATRCAQLAYEQAGVGPADVDVAEVHDAMAPAELLYAEQLGFCPPGDAAPFFRSGATALDGRLPINPSGGLASRGHPVGATGLAQLAELTWQLRGEAGERQVHRPRIALAQNSGGWLEGESAAVNVHLLERTQRWI
ncbi:thiolase family protein [Spongiactinospora rosea]|uniref:Thiolase family protein n=1 Tax=Spongiactinospora rosea TaxID=2248750 RepID=A0A366LPM8_9ACTN|nr:thiolase family protein [Spongiactinospora rosea]RBQ15851.1 thiolase family protein [Spongiactinospora rosea]